MPQYKKKESLKKKKKKKASLCSDQDLAEDFYKIKLVCEDDPKASLPNEERPSLFAYSARARAYKS